MDFVITKTAKIISGDILDKIQSAAQNAVDEIADFVTSNSEGLAIVIDQFKVHVYAMKISIL